MHHGGDPGMQGLGDIPEIARVLTRDDQRVPWGGGPDVQERDGVVVFEDAAGGPATGHDLTEDAVAHACHDRMGLVSGTSALCAVAARAVCAMPWHRPSLPAARPV